ncbi:MAG: DUF2723 domain-containing protein [Anaerolineae bacterium]|nr:DUF2723 domain-containing protein [Anaerolineae bacterium]
MDVGEFQVALSLWGTVHHTGYPLYMLLGSPFVTALRFLGVPPAAGASLYSTVWAVLAIGILVLLIHRISGNIWLAGALGLLFAVLEPVWVHGVIAEVYSFSAFLFLGTLYLTLDLRERWSDRKGWGLAFIGGIGVAHHRLLGVALLPISLFLFPIALRTWRAQRSLLPVLKWFGVAIPCFLAGFLPYLDIPLRIRLGTSWFYNRADTWEGFWHIFWAREVSGLMKPATAWAQWESALKSIGETLISDLTLPGLILIGLSALRGLGLSKTRPAASFVVFTGAAYLIFATAFHRAVLLQATLLAPLITFFLLLGIGLGSLGRRGSVLGTILCLGWAGWLGVKNYPFVISLTRDPTSVHYIAVVEQTDAPPGSVIMAPWGRDYFALSYAQRVEGRMPQWEIVDHRANFRALLEENPSRRGIYTHFSALFLFGPEWWAERLGKPLRITSAGPEMVMLTPRPLNPPESSGIPVGDGIVLNDWKIISIQPGVLHVILYWSATHAPSKDYSTFVHLTDQDEITRPEDLVAQVDYAAPVYGWYPTSQWVLYETIREDRIIRFPPERAPQTLFIGMYWRDENGAFHRLGRIALKNIESTWVSVP